MPLFDLAWLFQLGLQQQTKNLECLNNIARSRTTPVLPIPCSWTRQQARMDWCILVSMFSLCWLRQDNHPSLRSLWRWHLLNSILHVGYIFNISHPAVNQSVSKATLLWEGRWGAICFMYWYLLMKGGVIWRRIRRGLICALFLFSFTQQPPFRYERSTSRTTKCLARSNSCQCGTSTVTHGERMRLKRAG